ncbi:hypothetical protein F5Y18DRAFT_199607 [Xylariaceae sp. FL1019]|nr:hypothetical protein F5Y18DRAFT_199607 [Xylariaceae sp. FL1019]
MYETRIFLMLALVATIVNPAMIIRFLSTLGFLAVALTMYHLVRILSVAQFFYDRFHIAREGKTLEDYKIARDGRKAWAFVTNVEIGAGIGYSFAGKLAQRGFNVVVHCRDEASKVRARHELQRHSTDHKFRWIVGDLDHKPPDSIHSSFESLLEVNVHDIPLKLFVNCMGPICGTLSPYDDLGSPSATNFQDTYNRYMMFPTVVASFLNPFLARESSLVLNIENIDVPTASSHPLHRQIQQNMRHHTHQLRGQMKKLKRDVKVLALRIGPLTPGDRETGTRLRPTRREFMDACFTRLDRLDNTEIVITPWFWHELWAWWAWWVSMIPDSWRANPEVNQRQ